MTIKAIETSYKGHRFRSRLEARWAVFFDAMRVPYRYELEGLDMDGVWYLPDFWVPYGDHQPYPEGTPTHCGFWVEIKPVPLNDAEKKKAALLALKSNHTVYAFAGDPWPGEFAIYSWRKDRAEVLLPDMCCHCGGNGECRFALVCKRHQWRGESVECSRARRCGQCEGTGRRNEEPIKWIKKALWGFLWETRNAEWENADLDRAFRLARRARFDGTDEGANQ